MKKFSGNNQLQLPFEAGYKRITDLQNLVNLKLVIGDPIFRQDSNYIEFQGAVDNNMLVVIGIKLFYKLGQSIESIQIVDNVQIVSNEIAKRFNTTRVNIPWIDNPICTITDNNVRVYIDPIEHRQAFVGATNWDLEIQYVNQPTTIDYQSVEDINDYPDSVWQEVINLAVSKALDNIESSRVQVQPVITQAE